jgi:hypothetical protein
VLIVLPFASVLWTVAYLNIRVKYEGLRGTRLSKDLGVVGPVEDTIHELSVENDELETTILHDKFDNMRNAIPHLSGEASFDSFDSGGSDNPAKNE